MLEESNSVGSAVSELGEVSMDNSNQGSNDGAADFSYDFKSKKKSETDILAAQAQCYKRLSDLLEKSQRYTALLCDRIEKDNNSFALLLKAKSEQMLKQVKQISDKNSKKVPEQKRRGRPAKRKREVDQVVPDHSNEDSAPKAESASESPSVPEIRSDVGSTKNELSYNQPLLVTGGNLRKYQLEGVSWLMKLYLNGVNGILADEMGLGKTIQCISFISDLICLGATGPFLVCGPLSTLLNWMDEFKKFAPAVPCIMYYGKTKDERLQILRAINESVTLPGYEYSSKPVVVTSYEVSINDSKLLGKIKWDLLIVDEGHRIKNSNCRLIRELKTYNTSHRLLLTGTPLQNNLSELWTLLNFLIPEIFSGSGSFETWFDVNFLENVDNADEQIAMEEEKSSTLSKIHQILTPFMLRRLKSDVDIVIPPKKELLVIAPFAPEQKNLYKAILDKTISQMSATNDSEKISEEVDLPRTLRKRGRKSVDYSLAFEDVDENIDDDESSLTAWAEAVVSGKEEATKESNQGSKMQQPLHVKHMLSMLRKCCNHPCLLQTREEGKELTEEFVSASGKLQLMDRMLAKLKSQGHRVLIFSQSTQLLDLLDEYCLFRGHSFCRLDGRMSFSERQEEIKRFNEKNIFLFLLSTRAGGLGINLTKADTVIIYDSDWNPQCDLQAQDRCHRIGQSNPVVIYRLVVGGSVDQKIVERAAAKRKLEKIIIHKDKFKMVDSHISHDNQSKVVDPRELLSILKETDYQDVVRDVGMSDHDLDGLLNRSDLNKAWQEQKLKKIQNIKVADEEIIKCFDSDSPYFRVIEDH